MSGFLEGTTGDHLSRIEQHLKRPLVTVYEDRFQPVQFDSIDRKEQRVCISVGNRSGSVTYEEALEMIAKQRY